MALKQIKNKIVATKKTGKVTKAMEAVSAVKMRKSQERALAGKTYAEAALRILSHVSQSYDKELHLSDAINEDAPHCMIVITSDKGLAGGLNSTVLKDASLALEGVSKSQVRIIAFGKKAVEYFTRLGYKVDATYTNVSDDVSLVDMKEVTEKVTKGFIDGEYSRVSIAYQNFVSTFEQNALTRQILPFDPIVLEVMVRDIVPKKGMYSDIESEYGRHVYTVEPSPEEVAEILIPQLVQIMLYHAMLENKASEHSARMVAMKGATDKSQEMIKSLTLKFNQKRQAAITAEVSEIAGGMEAMKES